ncbi:AMP-binding protein [Streptomonospora algeriensis]|uniref:AMP-binding protein n=1 Tax=Streptomonospora algeriensis TaxID=995084 RepID=A0ABW3BAX2_9ACTN
MTTTQDTTGTGAGPEPYDLGPFQRAAVGADAHTVRLRSLVPGGPVEELRDAVAAAVTAAPVLTAEYIRVPGMRIPRQAVASLSISQEGVREWAVTGGTLRAAVSGSDAGRVLELSCDAAFADTASISLLLEDIALRLDRRTPESSVDFAVVAPGHTEMLREGELAAEEAYWARRRERTGEGLVLDEVVPKPVSGSEGPPGAASRRLTREESTGLDALADRLGCEVADLAQLALETVLLRLGVAPETLGRLEDARSVMGLDRTIGPLSQVLPGGGRTVDLAGTARESLSALTEQRARDAEMLGGPAFAPYMDRPELVLDRTGSPVAPQGWRILSWWNPAGGGIGLSLSRCDGSWELQAQTERSEEHERVASLVAMWSGLLMDLLVRPDAPLSDLALLSNEAPASFFEEAERVPAESVIARLERHFAQRPEAPACRRGEQVWTYRMLQERVSRIAGVLSHLPPGSVVAVALEPGVDLVAAQVAVLARGAVFIPLSAEEPEARILDALERAGAAMLLVGKEAPDLRTPSSCGTANLAELDGRPAAPIAPTDLPADAPAYMMRTSGSSGKPKLLAISRRSLDNYLRWVDESLLGEGEEFPLISSPVFDASLKQTLGALYAGGTVRLLESDRLDTDAVRDELAGLDTRLVLNCVPGYLSELLVADERRGATMPVVRFLIGGEPLPSELVRRVEDRYPDSELWNLYGPTEATATATAGLITAPDRIHVGSPVAGAGLAVVDPHGAVLPAGVRGEVVITGPGLSAGYLSGHEGASPFVPLKVGGSSRPSYRTGDIGIVDHAGYLWLTGRSDRQIKINGWRIDPGELERVAQQVEGVRDAAAVFDERGEEGCLRLFTTGDADAERISVHLRDTLPGPMLPASVTPLDRFDTGVTGKVDRWALLERLEERSQFSPDEYTPQEYIVARAWREILQQGWPDPRADFFSVGGHSLLLARLVNQLRAEGHHELSLRQVVRNPTVASMAGLVGHTT